MDLTKKFPRSPVDKLHGIDHLRRLIDKARAHNSGTLGEYNYNCPMDQLLLTHLGVSAEDFARIVATHTTDETVYAELWKRFPKALSPEAISTFNAHYEAAAPDTPEKQAWFDSVRNAIDPSRTDIRTWVRLLDLEEKRHVPVL
ncbi:MAG: DUF5069 domain-containing protein [Leptospirillia bacterium]|jgi:hypothetical protein